MRLEAAGLCVEVPGGPTVVLSWDLYGKVGTVMDGPARDGWAIAYWIQGRGAGRGFALCVSGCVEAEAHPRSLGPRDR